MDEEEYKKVVVDYKIDTNFSQEKNMYLLTLLHHPTNKKFEIAFGGETFYIRPGDYISESMVRNIRGYIAKRIYNFEASLTKDIELF